VFVGVDVAEGRGCAWCILDERHQSIAAGWVDHNPQPRRTAESLHEVLQAAGAVQGAAVGIDAPRMPLSRARKWRWTKEGWSGCDEGKVGRHCEIVIRALNLANPQWTPTRQAAPGWMRVGFALFEILGRHYETFEVFPSASYKMLDEANIPCITLPMRAFRRGPQDMLDAHVAALTVAEFKLGRGCEVGGGDGLGTIVLPRCLEECDRAMHSWPETE
jgi:hypothetical protein